MAVLSIILLVLFVLVAVLLIFLVSIQSEDNAGLGGVFGGSSDSAFGGQTNKVITRITAYVVAAFIVLAIAVAFVNKSPDSSIFGSSLRETAAANAGSAPAADVSTAPAASETAPATEATEAAPAAGTTEGTAAAN